MTTYKVGQVFYSASAYDDGSCAIDEWHIRTIRGGYVHSIMKNDITWGKRSKKNGDFGWLKSIPVWTRQKWRVDGAPVARIKSTKLAAIRHEIKNIDADDFNTPEEFEKAKRSLKAMETRAKTKRKFK